MTQFKQEWGSEVAIDGTKPDWLDASELVAIHTARDGAGSNGWYGLYQGNSDFFAREIAKDDDLIRLRAGHPHYDIPAVSPTPDERAVAPELVERMIDLVTTMAGRSLDVDDTCGYYGAARAIVAALEPVDEDVEIAKEMAQKQCFWNSDELFHSAQDLALAAIKRGLQLEKEGK